MRAELYQGDCLDLLKTLPDGCIDMVLTDPPYASTAQRWDKMLNWAEIWPELKRVCKVNAAKLFFSCNAFTIDLCASNRKEYRYRYVWQKTFVGNVYNRNSMPLRKYEEVSVFYSKQPTYNPQMGTGPAYNQKPLICRNSIWGKVSAEKLLKQDLSQLSDTSRAKLAESSAQLSSAQSKTSSRRLPYLALNIVPGVTNVTTRYPTDILNFKPVHNFAKGRVHPNQKPVDMLEHLIKTYTNEGETVLDFTMGSGSTGVACMNTGRNFVGFEMDARYCRIAADRITEAFDKAYKEQGHD